MVSLLIILPPRGAGGTILRAGGAPGDGGLRHRRPHEAPGTDHSKGGGGDPASGEDPIFRAGCATRAEAGMGCSPHADASGAQARWWRKAKAVASALECAPILR